jgi:hypothetical protein
MGGGCATVAILGSTSQCGKGEESPGGEDILDSQRIRITCPLCNGLGLRTALKVSKVMQQP